MPLSPSVPPLPRVPASPTRLRHRVEIPPGPSLPVLPTRGGSTDGPDGRGSHEVHLRPRPTEKATHAAARSLALWNGLVRSSATSPLAAMPIPRPAEFAETQTSQSPRKPIWCLPTRRRRSRSSVVLGTSNSVTVKEESTRQGSIDLELGTQPSHRSSSASHDLSHRAAPSSHRQLKRRQTWFDLFDPRAAVGGNTTPLDRSRSGMCHPNPWLFIFVYVRIKRLARRYARTYARADDNNAFETEEKDVTQWSTVVPVSFRVMFDGDEELDIAAASLSVVQSEKQFLHISKTHLYFRDDNVKNTDHVMVRIAQITALKPGLDAIVLTFEKLVVPSGVAVGVTLVSEGLAALTVMLFDVYAAALRRTIEIMHVQRRRRSLTIVHFNDVYHLEPTTRNANLSIVGGAARFMTLLSKLRENSNPLVLFSGDFMGPSLQSVLTKGRQMIDAFNFMGVHFGTFGNHEFDYGLRTLKDVVHGYTKGKMIYSGSQTRWIMTNMTEGDKSTPLGFAEPYAMITWSGIALGIIALSENWLPQCTNLRPGEAHYFDIYEVGERMAQTLRQRGAEVILALTHCTAEVDIQMAERCPSIDLILGGHDHYYKNDPRHRLLKSGQEFEYLSQVVITLRDDAKATKKNSSGKIDAEAMRPRVRVNCHVVSKDVQEHPRMQEIIQRYAQKMIEKLGKRIGKTDFTLDSREITLRYREGRLTNFIADVIATEMDVDFAVLGAAAVRGECLTPPGYVTIGDLFNWFPNDTRIMTMRMHGVVVLQLLNIMVREVPAEAQSFPHPSGKLKFTINLFSRPPTVRDVRIGGQPLDLRKVYTVAVEDFVGLGKAKYKRVAADSTVVVSDEEAVQVVAMLLKYFNRQASDDGREDGIAVKSITKATSATSIGVDAEAAVSEQFVRSLVCELMHSESAALLSVDHEFDLLWHDIQHGDETRRIEISSGPAYQCYRTREVVNCREGPPDEQRMSITAVDFAIEGRELRKAVRGTLAVPISLSGDKCDMVLQVVNKTTGTPFDVMDEMKLRLLGEQVGFRMLNREIYTRASREFPSHPCLHAFKLIAADAHYTIVDLLKDLNSHATYAVPTCAGTMVLYIDPDTGTLRTLDDSEDRFEDDLQVKNVSLESNSLVQQAIDSRLPSVHRGMSANNLFGATSDLPNYRQVLLVPILRVSSSTLSPIGVVVWMDKRADFNDTDVAVAQYFCEFAAVSIQNSLRLIELVNASGTSSLKSVCDVPIHRIRWHGGWTVVRDAFRAAVERYRRQRAATGMAYTSEGASLGDVLKETFQRPRRSGWNIARKLIHRHWNAFRHPKPRSNALELDSQQIDVGGAASMYIQSGALSPSAQDLEGTARSKDNMTFADYVNGLTNRLELASFNPRHEAAAAQHVPLRKKHLSMFFDEARRGGRGQWRVAGKKRKTEFQSQAELMTQMIDARGSFNTFATSRPDEADRFDSTCIPFIEDTA